MDKGPPRGQDVQSVPEGRPVTFWLWDLWPYLCVPLLPGVVLSQVPSFQALLFWKSIAWPHPHTRELTSCSQAA